MKKFDLLVYIGRFQPPHKAHIRTIEQALELSEKVLVLLGSSQESRIPKNPWSDQERIAMILKSVEDNSKLFLKGINDIPESNERWAEQVVNESDFFEGNNIGIIGHKKDESSFYLDLFPEWELVEMENTCGTNATDIREKYFNMLSLDMSWANDLPLGVVEYLKEFKGTEQFLEVFNQINYESAHYK